MDLCKFITPQTVLCSRGPSLYFMQHYILYTCLIHPISVCKGQTSVVVRRGAGSRTCLYHICMVLKQPARNHRQQRACPLDSKTLRQPQAFLFQPLPLSLFNRLCCVLVSGAPEIRVRAFDVTAFLVCPAQAATTLLHVPTPF